jgi:hypothetical protein
MHSAPGNNTRPVNSTDYNVYQDVHVFCGMCQIPSTSAWGAALVCNRGEGTDACRMR